MPPRPKATETSAQNEARRLLMALETIDLDKYSVAGNCLRFDERSRNVLKEFRQRVAEALLSKSPAPKNFLLWGAPGSGKSYLVQQVARTLPPGANYQELNLAQLTRETLRSGLDTFVGSTNPGVCFIDEVDARSDEAWPYETLLPYLESAGARRAPTVFCLAGSGGASLEELAGELRSRPKGADLLSRIPQGNQFTVAPLGIGDKILVSTAQLTLAAHEEGRSVREIEKLALYFFAVHSSFRSARELRHRAAQCAQRMPVSDDRVRYDYLFLAGDPENKRFWNESEELRKGLEDSFVRVESGLPPPSGPSRASEPRTLRLEPASEVRTAPRIAVLPLANISPDPKDEYFADGLTEELISVLSQIRGLRVIARTSVSQYKATVKPVSQIGAELGVSSILEGSVRKADSQLRVTVQLIDVGTEEHRWSQSYDRKLENVFAIQAEIAERTAEALKVELLRSEREAIQEKPTSNLAAYESYLRGIQAFRHESEAFETGRSVERDAEKHFEEAFRIDPQFAGAYSYLANHLLAVMAITRPAQDVVPRVRELVAKALELNPNSSDAHAALGNLAFQGDLDWTRAEAEFQQAIVLNPSSSTARFWYGYLLWALQRFPESKKQYLAAIELDPLWLLPRLHLAGEIFDAGDLPTAITECERLREKFGDSSTVRWSLAFYYAIAGRFKDAFALVESLKGATDPDSRARRSMILTQLGMPNELREFLADVEHGRVPEYLPLAGTAALHALLGEKEIALDLLNRDYREGDRALWGAYQGTFFDGLRDDPRFVALLEEYRLPKRLTRPLVGPSP